MAKRIISAKMPLAQCQFFFFLPRMYSEKPEFCSTRIPETNVMNPNSLGYINSPFTINRTPVCSMMRPTMNADICGLPAAMP